MTSRAEIALITGGGRSGKSTRALELAARHPRKFLVATAQAFDEEMRARIDRHRAERGPEWTTIEEPFDLAGAIAKIRDPSAAVVIDCLTVWLGNLLFRDKAIAEDSAPVTAFLDALVSAAAACVIVVTNEVGAGIIPADAETRRWRDLAGRVNQRVAALADRVVLMVCGLPLSIKETRKTKPTYRT